MSLRDITDLMTGFWARKLVGQDFQKRSKYARIDQDQAFLTGFTFFVLFYRTPRVFTSFVLRRTLRCCDFSVNEQAFDLVIHLSFQKYFSDQLKVHFLKLSALYCDHRSSLSFPTKLCLNYSVIEIQCTFNQLKIIFFHLDFYLKMGVFIKSVHSLYFYLPSQRKIITDHVT